MLLVPGFKVGPYEIVSPLGAGGMGTVYRARDERLRRDVAIKVLAHGLFADDEALRRFHREARALAKLSHPNIATVYDVGEQDGVTYLVMELVPGETLASRLASGPMSIRDALRMTVEIAAALEDAHEHGVVHRDLKPANVVVTPKGHVRVLDFGIAKLVEPTTSTVGLTDTKGPIGTPVYMSPEQVSGDAIDARSDLWSLGSYGHGPEPDYSEVGYDARPFSTAAPKWFEFSPRRIILPPWSVVARAAAARRRRRRCRHRTISRLSRCSRSPARSARATKRSRP